MITAWLRSLLFTNGLRLDLEQNSVLVIVGPNDSGKSATLSAIKRAINGEALTKTPLEAIELVKSPSADEVLKRLEPYLNRPDRQDPEYRTGSHVFREANARHWMSDGVTDLGYFAKFALSILSTRDRLSACDPPVNLSARDMELAAPIDARNENRLDHPFQKMFRDPRLELVVSKAVRRAFSKDLIVHRANGNSIPAYVGDRPALGSQEREIDLSYLHRLEKLDRLEDQGDGIRSFVAIVSHVVTEGRSIQLIDEPEAFLHPPQARLVAEMVVTGRPDLQTVVATHSREVLRGLLNSDSERVTVVRLNRKGGETEATHLVPAKISQLWRDASLRFSNILDGLFHQGVIVAEGDSDCRFYEAMLHAAVPASELSDVHFSYTGGKDRLALAIAALTALNVPVAAIVDCDVLNDERPLRNIYEAQGGDWRAIEADWLIVKSAVEAISPRFISAPEFVENVRAELEKCDGREVVPRDVRDTVKKLTRRSSPWDEIKLNGFAALPSGTASTAGERLERALASQGVFVVPLGTMESFCPSIKAYRGRFVAEVLRKDVRVEPELEDARRFLRAVCAYFPAQGGNASSMDSET